MYRAIIRSKPHNRMGGQQLDWSTQQPHIASSMAQLEGLISSRLRAKPRSSGLHVEFFVDPETSMVTYAEYWLWYQWDREGSKWPFELVQGPRGRGAISGALRYPDGSKLHHTMCVPTGLPPVTATEFASEYFSVSLLSYANAKGEFRSSARSGLQSFNEWTFMEVIRSRDLANFELVKSVFPRDELL